MTQVEANRKAGRTLLYVPIIHTYADLGGMGERVKQAVSRDQGMRGWQQRIRAVDQLWTRIERAMMRQELSFDRVRVYQDGLPLCGREEEIVRDLAQSGSRNHQLLLQLMERGAVIMGTESASLLIKEYELVNQDAEKAKNTGRKTRNEEKGSVQTDLLRQRDTFIADRINRTLQCGETGILFLGMLHDLSDRLDKDIRVSYPVERPSRSRS